MIVPSLEELMVVTAGSVRPPERLTVPEAAEKYRFLNNPGSYVGPWDNSITPYMVEPQEVLTSLEHTGMIFVGPARTGKALALDTPIATRDGWSTMGDIKVGDIIFDEQGKQCRVINATEVMFDHDCYTVKFSDGDQLVADADHRWQVIDSQREYRDRVLSTREIAETATFGNQGRNRYSVIVSEPLQTEAADLPLDPYVLGAWLGDGHSSGARIFSGDQDIENMTANLNACGVETRGSQRGDGNWTIALSAERHTPGRKGGAAGVSKALRSLGMSQAGQPKYIPASYLRGSVHQRFALLQGLMDTDGYCDHRGQLEFCTTAPGIAEPFSELLSSLGYKYCLLKRPAAAKIAHRFMFYVREGEKIFRLKRKQARLDLSKPRSIRNRRRPIVSVERADSVPVRCIQVDSKSSLFLAGRNMIPTHNSDTFFNYLIHTAKTDPADMTLYQMTQATARDWSQKELKRAIRHSPALGECLARGRHNHNVHDILFSSGMQLQIKWPSITELSGKTIPRLWLMDYDRMPQDVEGEGNPYDLAKKRAQTFKRFGMCVAESSPGFEVDDPKWIPTPEAPHEAPPTKGILSLYNRGDRRRWNWRCPQCDEAFEADFKHLLYPKSGDPMEAAEAAVLVAPCCGFPIEPALKNEINRAGRWVKEGQVWHPKTGEMIGRPRRSDIGSFWLKGTAAAFQDWKGLVLNYLRAKETFERTGDEQPLKVTTNTDQGHPYVPQAIQSSRSAEDLKGRATDWGGSADDPVVPPGARFLAATIDVQARAFVVQVHGYGPGGDAFIVDMFKIRKSERLDADGERLPVDPASYAEDWELLIPQVIERTYPLGDGSDRRMAVKITGCDSGGREGVTAVAYAFWRSLRDDKEQRGHHKRFMLVKGTGSKTAPRAQIIYPDSNRKDRHAGARGDVPVLQINTNLIKDQVSAKLGRKDQGADEVTIKVRGAVLFPEWTPNWFYSQLTAEIRVRDKGWENPTQKRNEAWDLLVYAEALCLTPAIRIEQLDWEATPWAKDWDENELVFGEEVTNPFETHEKVDYDSLANLAADLA